MHPVRLSAAAAAVTLLVPLGAVPALAADADAPAAKGKDVQLLSLTDFHGRLGDGAGAGLASVIERERSLHKDIPTALVSSGDNVGASTYASSSQQDNPTIDYLNAIELDASSVGNHEFDKGADDIANRLSKRADFPFLGANVYTKGTQNIAPGMKAYKVIEQGGVKIGVIGVVTKETASLVSPDGIKDVTFGDPLEGINRAAKEMAALPADQKPDMTVLTAHIGSSQPDKTLEVAKQAGPEFKKIVEGADASIDAMYFGHTHLSMNFTERIPGTDRTRPIMQASNYGTKVGQSILTSEGNGDWTVKDGTDKLLETKGVDFDSAAVKKAKGIIEDAEDKAKEIGSEVAGTIADDFDRAKKDDGAEDRAAESTLGNLVGDALKEGTEGSQLKAADLGLTNPGGMRADLKKDSQFGSEKPGEVTVGELNQVLPFANDYGVVALKGKDLEEVFEQQFQPEGSSRPFLHLGVSKNVRVVYDSKDTKQRVKSVLIDGKKIDADKTYRVATLSFLAAGGDNFTALSKGEFEQSGLTDFDVWKSYFAKHKDLAPDRRERQADAAEDMIEANDLSYSVKVAQGGGETGQRYELTLAAKKDVPGPLRFAVSAPQGAKVAFAAAEGTKADGSELIIEARRAGTAKVAFTVSGGAQGAQASARGARAAAAQAAPATAQPLQVALTSDRAHAFWDDDPLPLVHAAEVDAAPAPDPTQPPSEQPSGEPSQDPSQDPSQGPGQPGPGEEPSSTSGPQRPGDDGRDDSGSGSGHLPRTGAQIAGLVGAAALLLLVGGATMALTRRRD
ncbi:5'-nucleotidase C-terminal domain-containing protein [Brevibacterium sp. BRM-1]|uniref:bifunctional metallophosphatase/5'-nucleotidase n=1 Tax=Brevibacterium sp. BRM-1 TaxID=2999062 RepID=UPI0022822AA0|nr:5'-nucleotidase C-terminal domain-containing protein [Brevibacterium sp. BRM-1]WAL40154.1 5'-nucleotidase C-terminal domain-containing protein [Brevibacterium sp. BRM-1]